MIPLAFLISLVLLAVAAALRAAGASLVRTPRADALRDQAEGDARAGLVADLLDDRARLQPSLGMVHSALLVLAALPAAWALTAELSGWALALGLVALGVTLVAVGDVLPRTYGRKRPRRLAYRFAWLLEKAVRLGAAATDLLSDDGAEESTAEEASDDGFRERELISSVLEFSEALVREVMVPRLDMVAIDQSASTDAALDLFVTHGYSRIPVTGGNGDEDVVGIVYAKDLLRLMDLPASPTPVSEVMREPYFVPETKKVPALLRDMQASQVHIAVVVDEFGGLAGLVTIEDLLEELVGEIADEYDTEDEYVIELSRGEFLVDARLPVDDLSELLGVDLPNGDWDTVGGLVLDLAGRVPSEGERFEFDGVVLIPSRVQGRRVAQVRALTNSPKPAG